MKYPTVIILYAILLIVGKAIGYDRDKSDKHQYYLTTLPISIVRGEKVSQKTFMGVNKGRFVNLLDANQKQFKKDGHKYRKLISNFIQASNDTSFEVHLHPKPGKAVIHLYSNSSNAMVSHMNNTKGDRASQYKVNGGKDQILATLTSLVDNSDTSYLPQVVVDLKNDTTHMKYPNQSQNRKAKSRQVPSYKKANIVHKVPLNGTATYQILNITEHRPSDSQNARMGGLPVASRQNMNYIKRNRMKNEYKPRRSKHTRQHENLHGEQQDIHIKPNSTFPIDTANSETSNNIPLSKSGDEDVISAERAVVYTGRGKDHMDYVESSLANDGLPKEDLKEILDFLNDEYDGRENQGDIKYDMTEGENNWQSNGINTPDNEYPLPQSTISWNMMTPRLHHIGTVNDYYKKYAKRPVNKNVLHHSEQSFHASKNSETQYNVEGSGDSFRHHRKHEVSSKIPKDFKSLPSTIAASRSEDYNFCEVTLAIASCEEHLSECNYDLDPTSHQDCEKLKKCCEEIGPTGKEPIAFTETIGNKKLGNYSHEITDKSGISDDPRTNAKTKKLQLINHGSRNQSSLDTNTTIEAYNNFNKSNRQKPKSNWQSLCEKSVAIAKILNSFSMKLSNILVTTLDKIFRNTKKISNQSDKLATPAKSYKRQ